MAHARAPAPQHRPVDGYKYLFYATKLNRRITILVKNGESTRLATARLGGRVNPPVPVFGSAQHELGQRGGLQVQASSSPDNECEEIKKLVSCDFPPEGGGGGGGAQLLFFSQINSKTCTRAGLLYGLIIYAAGRARPAPVGDAQIRGCLRC
ncbi:hypothetical protein EVAR_54888_1 [Eumeta japonica]|uniref:Uncharacterized protein n=1 Tax=Eumeta variegata TaxID=151549 RepID=A0A4C2A112_EUMVA|nr:hypothetical protein EVAR_54888_1 [Eumeta japonica]